MEAVRKNQYLSRDEMKMQKFMEHGSQEEKKKVKEKIMEEEEKK